MESPQHKLENRQVLKIFYKGPFKNEVTGQEGKGTPD